MRKIDAKSIIKKIKQEEEDRTKTSLYLSKKLYEEFKKKCGDLPTSRVLEELIRQFVDDLK